MKADEISAEEVVTPAAAAEAVTGSVVVDGETSRPERNNPSKSPGPDSRELQELYELMLRENLESLDLQEGPNKIRLNRGAGESHPAVPQSRGASAPPASAKPAPEVASFPGEPVHAPLAGVFYRAASPTSAPFVKEGDLVESGHTLCIIEAMKVMNEIKAPKRGKITKILSENSRPVTAGQVLFWLEPAE